MCFILTVQVSNAQFLKRIQNKVENKVEEKVEQKATDEAEKAADNLLDKVLGTTKKSENTIKTTNSYTFNQSITLEMETKGNDKAQLDFLFDSKNLEVVCMKLADQNNEENGQVYTVLTPTSSVVYMDMPGMKMKKEMNKDQLEQMDYSDKISQKSDLVKTGKTKTVLGYTCDEYMYENDGGKIRAWVTNDFPIKGKYVPILGMKQNGPFDGFVMELWFDTQSESGSIKVIKIDTNTNVKIDTNAYKSI